MKNLKFFEDILLKTLADKDIIDKIQRVSLLKERIVKKKSLLQSLSAIVSQDTLLEILAQIYNAKIAQLDDISVNESSVADEIFSTYDVVLGAMDGQFADIYLFEPIFEEQLKKIEDILDKKIRLFVVSKDIYEKITKDIKYGIEYKKNYVIRTNDELRALSEEEIAISFSEELLQKCFDIKASDIHIEPLKNSFRVRMRLNGILEEFGRYDSELYPSLSSRIKLLSKLDIAERRKTQDGALLFKTLIEAQSVDVPFRVSVMPTIYGEKIVLRRLSSGEEAIYLSQIGMDEETLQKWKRAIKRPHGIILVSGPTGSGKSTTLFAAINEINKVHINITTIEDPVEFKIPGVNQIHIDSYKVSFADALRSILRQDPDVIMLGEIRDKESAEIALRASLTGHMVFSTIHTNDAASSATRLIDMGIEPFLVSSSVVGILAQRLIRILCDGCKEEYILDDFECDMLGILKNSKVCRAKGCRKCNGSGYIGRTGVYEFLLFDETIRQMITQNKNDSEIKSYAIEVCGMKTILESAKELLINSRTSVDELLRISAE